MSWLARLKSQICPDTHPTEPTEPGFVGFVGTPDGHIQRIDGDALPANDSAPDLDRWCWPQSTAMNTAEIDRFTARLAQFTDHGVTQLDAEVLADRLLIRDRENDDRAMCMECTNVLQAGRCSNWERAGVAMRAKDAQLPGDFVSLLQRCDGFRQSIHFSGGNHGQT